MDAGDYRKSADALGGILADVTTRSHFENICSEAVHYELQAQFGDDYKNSGLYGFLLKKMAKAASDYVLSKNIGPRDFEDNLNEALGIVRSLRYAFVRDGSDNPSPNFWDNTANPIHKIRAKQVPYIDRSGLECAVDDYLALPYRSQALDRFLVRALIAVELYAFGDEMLNEKPLFGFPARSPLKQSHVLLGYLRALLLNAVLLGGIAALALWAASKGWIGETAAGWTTGICVALFVLLSALSTFGLPFAWRRQIKARREVSKLLLAMNTIYSELKSDGPISAQYIRDRSSSAAQDGVVWPAPLFAMLDDIIARTGRF
ncbi:hypothetical protein CQ14_07075 [Bradyrhizobium lablabi]|uniref:Uncharacterized protein n=1 Tax=Bradyrhizobium lablabi TaxID=722472 RepID=A0A0R3MN03_9BRAD|nr:hypothetical protein [Bradyrhizobium lablabi]KRR21403.1 hypothetical protein CQ14_07075 [Bradyrhizobium lablabi]